MAHNARSNDHQRVSQKQYFDSEAQIDSLWSGG